jgi:hypothetical protein
MPADSVQEQVDRDADGRFQQGQSGNPERRPAGVRNKATEAELLVYGEGEASALRLCLERITPRRERRVNLGPPPVRRRSAARDRGVAPHAAC